MTSCECHTRRAGTDEVSWAPCALSQHGLSPVHDHAAGSAVQPWLRSCHEHPAVSPGKGNQQLWVSRDTTQGTESWDGAWTGPARSGWCCEQCGHGAGTSSWARSWAHSLVGFNSNSGYQVWSLPCRKMKGFSSTHSIFLSIFSYLTITWLHPSHVGKAHNNLDIFPTVSWKTRAPVKGTVLPVGHGKFSWQCQGLPSLSCLWARAVAHRGQCNVQKMPGNEMGEVGWHQLHFRKDLSLTQYKNTVDEKQEFFRFRHCF